MSSLSVDGLAKLIVQLRLVEPADVDRCLAEFGVSRREPEDLLKLLESRSLLTSYQTSMLAKGESDGLVLGGNKLLYRNASGSFARVFRAESIDTGEMVGLKLLRQRWAKDKDSVQQFHREAQVCKRLQHKNIVPIYEIGQQGDYHFFTMEFVEGGNLRDFITIRQKLSAAEALRCVLDMAEGLEYALRMGLTHRDLKLTNVLMSTTGVAKLVDFGLAGEGSGSGAQSGDGVPRALEYATLEKGTGAPNNDPRSDLFFLGTIFYELLTGVPPYPRTRSREERKQLSRYSHVRAIRDVDPGLAASLGEVVSRMMQLNPNERYQTPTEVVADLRRLTVQVGANGVSGGSSVNDSQPAMATPNDTPGLPTVMCIESRPKHQEVLREYLSKHGFRVLVLSDVQRGINRMEGANPPDCVLMMGESVGSATVAAYQRMLAATENGPMAGLVVLSKKQDAMKSECRQTNTARVIVQPVTLRELRREIHLALQKSRSDSGEVNAIPADAG